MKKTMMIVALFLALLVPSVLGATPVYQGGFTLSDVNISGSQPPAFRDGSQFAMWDNYIGIESFYKVNPLSVRHLGEIYNWRTGNNVYNVILDDLINCGSNMGSFGTDSVKYADGNLFLGRGITCITQFGRLAVFDVTSIGFISQRLHSGTSVDNPTAPLLIYESNGATADFLIQGTNLHINGTDGLETLTAIGIGEPYPIFVDNDNGYFVDDDGVDIYRYNSGDLTDETLVGSLEPGSGVIVDWNRNEVNPEYMSSNGNILLVGGTDYNDFRTTSLGIQQFTPLFFFERKNIIGIVDNEFWSADMSDLGNIIETNTGVSVTGDVVKRQDSNKIITYNTTTREFRVYEVPEPTFTIETIEAGNTPPDPELSFLGLDGSNNFVFLTSIQDDEGGLIFYDLSITALEGGLLPGLFSDTLNFNTPADMSLVSSEPGDNCDVYKKSTTPYNWLTFEPSIVNLGLDPDCNYNSAYLSIDMQDVTSAESPLATITSGWTTENINPLNLDPRTYSYSLLDADGNYLFLLRFTDDDVTEKYNVSYYNGASYVPMVVNANGTYDLSFYPSDAFSVIAEVNFVNQSIDLNIQNSLPNIHLQTIPFLEPATSVGEVRFFEERSADQTLYVQSVRFLYNISPLVPGADYDLYGFLEAGERLFDAKAIPSESFGTYRAWLYATDETLGLANVDYWDEITFEYDSSTSILSAEQISSLVGEFQQSADIDLNNGFLSSPDSIPGDLVTDTFFGYLDEWNIKSTASKFFAGLVIILLFIGVGGWMGVQLKSPIVSTIGAGIGGIGAIFLVTYWGLFPAWVSFTIVLIVVGGISNMVRNSLTGRGGS